MSALQQLVFSEHDLPTMGGCRASVPESAAGARDAERDAAAAADVSGDTPAGQMKVPAARSRVKSLMVNPPGTAGLTGHGLITGPCPAVSSGAASRRCRRRGRRAPRCASPCRWWNPWRSARTDGRGRVLACARGLGDRDRGGQPRLGLDHDMRFEPVTAVLDGLMRMPGVRVGGGDHPARCDPPRDLPPPPVPSHPSAGSTS